jgi:6-pyruvoyl-tetrahydropterin synthase
MYSVGIKGKLTASHSLTGVEPEEAVPHAHTYTVEWRCRSQSLDERGFAVDIAFMEAALAELLNALAGSYLNDLEFFARKPVSVENLAAYIHGRLAARLQQADAGSGGTAPASEIRIWESESAWAAYSP